MKNQLEEARAALGDTANAQAILGTAIAHLINVYNQSPDRPTQRRVDELLDRIKLEQQHLDAVQTQIVDLIKYLSQEV